MNGFIEWLSLYPSRLLTLRVFVSIVVCLAVCGIAEMNNRKHVYWFIFCDGKKRDVVWREQVTYRRFKNFEREIRYGIIDRDTTKIWFNIEE